MSYIFPVGVEVQQGMNVCNYYPSLNAPLIASMPTRTQYNIGPPAKRLLSSTPYEGPGEQAINVHNTKYLLQLKYIQ